MDRPVLGLFTIAFLLCYVDKIDAKRSKVITITKENWRDTLQGEWMIKFYAPWCPACRSMESDYKAFADWSDDLNIQVGEVDINDQPGLSGRFIVTALPTIYHAKDGEFRRYTAERHSNALHRYVEEQNWRATEPVAWYRHPDSILMSLMSGLFQTSVLIKSFYETLTETYGFSSTMSYVIFGVATIATGLILGLILVFIIDCISPPKPRARSPQPPVEEEEEDVEKESAEEEEDDNEDDRQSTGRESVSGSEKEDTPRRGSQGGSSEDEEAKGSQASSQSSSQTSQEWEQIQGDEADEAKFETEKQIPAEKEEGQGEVRKRNVQKPDDDNNKE